MQHGLKAQNVPIQATRKAIIISHKPQSQPVALPGGMRNIPRNFQENWIKMGKRSNSR